jgi:hypothetical protein
VGYYLQRATRAALWRGVHERSRGWFLLGLGLAATRLVAGVLAQPETEARAVVRVEPGDAFEIRVVDPPAR